MGQGQDRTPAHGSVGVAIALMAASLAVTPLVLALIAVREATPQRGLIVAAALAWFVIVVAYRVVSTGHEHRRRRKLREEMADIRQARNESSSAFQDRLLEQQAIVERIRDISDRLLSDGITDPNLALNSVRLIQSHTRDAEAHIDDAIIEAQVGIGAESVFIEVFSVRDQVEEVVSQFARNGFNTVTSGPTLYSETDAAMFRLIIRSLINGAVTRDAEQIDVTVASDGDYVVCTVSDDGADTRKLGLKAVSGLARSLATTLEATIEPSHVLGRNRFAVAIPRVDAPTVSESGDPVDVLGSKPPSEEPQENAPVSGRLTVVSDLVTFERDDMDRSESVAARRERQLEPR